MTYVLFILYLHSGSTGPAMTTIDFKTHGQCEIVKTQIIDLKRFIKATCIESDK